MLRQCASKPRAGRSMQRRHPGTGRGATKLGGKPGDRNGVDGLTVVSRRDSLSLSIRLARSSYRNRVSRLT
jgi:hypothetical protein